MTSDEITLIKEIQKGEYESFTYLYEKYFKKVFTYILLKANGNTSIAEDITATTFMKAFENINKFSIDKNNSSFIARLYNIAYHAFLDEKKYDSNEYITSKDSLSSNIDYTEYFQTNIQTEQILKYLEELGSNKKDLFILRIREDLSYDEIANILGKRSSTCRKDFSKLIKKLAVHFKHFIDD